MVEIVGKDAYHPDCTCANVRRVHEPYCPKYRPAWVRRIEENKGKPIVASKVYQAR